MTYGLHQYAIIGTTSMLCQVLRNQDRRWRRTSVGSLLLFRVALTPSFEHPRPPIGRKRDVEALWRDFFANTSEWWDHRPEKINPRFPDFKHKKTGKALWLTDARKPPWVQAALAAIPPGTLQSNVFAWVQRLKRYVNAGQYVKTMEVFRQMQQERICPDTWTFLPVLNACAGLRILEEGRRVHRQIIQVGYDSDVHVATCLVNMYAKCGSIEDASYVFNNMREHNVVVWNAMIGGYVKSGQGLKAMDLFRKMQQEGLEPSLVTFIGVLNACTSIAALAQGRRVHEQIIGRGFESNDFVATCLVDMYAKCGSIEDAWNVFSKMQKHDVISWNAMIGGHVNSGQGLKAMELFWKMQQEGVEPSAITFVLVLNACTDVAVLEDGRLVHEQIIRKGFESDNYVATCLVDMYAKCGSIEDAWSVFMNMQGTDAISWNAMIGGYVKSGEGLKAIELFQKMQEERVEPSIVTFVGMLNACASVAALEEGRRVHGQITQKGMESDVYVATCLVDMYAKCGSLGDAWTVFHKMRAHNVISWNAMIGGCVKSGQGLKAIKLFEQMQHEGIEPSTVTFVVVLSACASLSDLEEGRRVHQQIIWRGCESDDYVATCLVDMYSKCGSVDDAWSVFSKMLEHDVISWNAMIAGYAKSGQGLKAMELFWKMQQEGVEPSTVTFVGLLNACTSLAALVEGMRVHEQIIRRGFESNVYVATCLVDMYAKCGSIEDAWSVFTNMPEHNVVSWNAIIAGYVKYEQGLKAMDLFRKMQQEGVEPNAVTFIAVLNACTSVAALEQGRRVHEQIIDGGCQTHSHVSTCLVDMYSKCGSIEAAWSVFSQMTQHNLVSWNAMLGGYAMHGHAKKAIGLFKQMGKACVELDEITFTCLLSACSHGGLVKEGLRYFKSMTVCYDILPTMEHYACMVDLLGRAGRLVEAEEMTKTMPMARDSAVWMSLLGACRIHDNIELAERVAKRCWELDPKNASGHVLLSNIYAASWKLDSRATIGE